MKMTTTDIKDKLSKIAAKTLNIGKDETVKSYKEFTFITLIKAAIYSGLTFLFYFTISSYIKIAIINTLLLWVCMLACVYFMFNAVKFMFPRYLVMEYLFGKLFKGNKLFKSKKRRGSLPKFRGL